MGSSSRASLGSSLFLGPSWKPRRSWRRLAFRFLPPALPFQGLGDLLGHVVLVVLGEEGVGPEDAARIDHAFRDDTLPLPKEVWDDAGIGDPHRLVRIGDAELDGGRAVPLDGPRLDETAQPEALAGRDALLGDV